jgi:recombination protein RecT
MSNIAIIDGVNKVEKVTLQKVDAMISSGTSFPANYDAKKAVLNAISIIKQENDLISCDPASMAQSLTYMVQLGLEPSTKQCYFIPRANKLTLSVSYFGNQTILKRIKGIKDVYATIIYEDDEFDYSIENGLIVQPEHKSSFKNRKSGIAGAYATIILDKEIYGRDFHVEVMDTEEIKTAWGQGATKGNSPAHKNFPQEMSKKTVISRACKNFINTLTDSNYIDMTTAMNEVNKSEFDNTPIQTEYEIKPQGIIEEPQIIEQRGNDFEFEPTTEETPKGEFDFD